MIVMELQLTIGRGIQAETTWLETQLPAVPRVGEIIDLNDLEYEVTYVVWKPATNSVQVQARA